MNSTAQYHHTLLGIIYADIGVTHSDIHDETSGLRGSSTL
jgi:hypothetical protein